MSEELADQRQQFAQWRSWATWGCAAAFFFFQFVVRVSPSVFANDLMLDLGIAACEFGTLSSIYYLSYSSVQLFVGLTLDRLGVRYPLALAAILILAGCLLFAQATTMPILIFARFVTGVGSALGFLSCVKTASMWFSSERLGLMIGLSILIGMAGATSGGYPMAYLVKHVGWRDSMMVLSVIAAVLCVVTILMAKDRKDPVGHSLVAEPEHITIIESLIILLSNPQTYIYAFYGALMYVPMSGFADVWGVKYMMLLYDVEALEASGSASITYIGLAASGPLLAMLSDHWRSYKKVMLMGSFLSFLGYLFVIYLPMPTLVLTYPLFFLIGFALGAQFFAFACIIEVNPRQVSATASGLQNMVCMYGGAASAYVIGHILDALTHGSVDSVIERYTISDFHIALAAVPASILLACVLMLFVTEAYPVEETLEDSPAKL
jgi:sugar phosphate permease